MIARTSTIPTTHPNGPLPNMETSSLVLMLGIVTRDCGSVMDAGWKTCVSGRVWLYDGCRQDLSHTFPGGNEIRPGDRRKPGSCIAARQPDRARSLAASPQDRRTPSTRPSPRSASAISPSLPEQLYGLASA